MSETTIITETSVGNNKIKKRRSNMEAFSLFKRKKTNNFKLFNDVIKNKEKNSNAEVYILSIFYYKIFNHFIYFILIIIMLYFRLNRRLLI